MMDTRLVVFSELMEGSCLEVLLQALVNNEIRGVQRLHFSEYDIRIVYKRAMNSMVKSRVESAKISTYSPFPR